MKKDDENEPVKDDPKKPALVRVWPKPGLVVRDEYSRLPIEPGAEVPYTRLTVRRLNDGDLLGEDPESPTSKTHTRAERFGGKGEV